MIQLLLSRRGSRRLPRGLRLFLLAGLLSSSGAGLGGALPAQTSTSFRLEEHVLNAGGHPGEGSALTSASFRLTLGALGGSVAVADSASPSFAMDGGFVVAYPPPGEATNVRFLDSTTLAWDGERSVGVYNLYLGTIAMPFDPGYGSCQTPGIATETVTLSVAPRPGVGLFILLTAKNRLAEEGTKGHTSADVERANLSPCP